MTSHAEITIKQVLKNMLAENGINNCQYADLINAVRSAKFSA